MFFRCFVQFKRKAHESIAYECERFKEAAGQTSKANGSYNFSFPSIFYEVGREFWILSRLPFSSYFHDLSRAALTFIYVPKIIFYPRTRSSCDAKAITRVSMRARDQRAVILQKRSKHRVVSLPCKFVIYT